MLSFTTLYVSEGVKALRVLLFNLSGIRYHRTNKMATQSYSQGINQQKCVGLFRYSNWLSSSSHVKFEQLKICETCCKNGRHRKNVLTIKISRHTFICHYLWNVLAKFHDNPSIYIPYKFAQRGCIPPKIKCKILSCKGL